MKTLRDYIDLITQLHEAPDTVVPGGGSITNVDPNSAEGKAMIARSQAVQAGKSPDSAAPAPGQAATPAPAAAPAAAAPKTWNKGVLGKGMKGPEVSALQKKLGIADTGTYDAATIAAVQALQKKLGVAADGAYGPGTKAAHDKMPPEQAATPAPAAPVNVAAPGQPPSTAAQPELGTKKGATQAIPVVPVNPANPGGATSKAQLTADEAKAALDNGSPRDIQALGGEARLKQLAGITPAAAPASGTPPAAPTGQAATPAAATSQSAQSAAVSADYSSANDQGRNPNAGLEPGDPRWRGAPPAAPTGQAPAAGTASASPQQAATPAAAPAAAPGETGGGAVTARPVRPATGARAQQLVRQQGQNQMPESRDTPFQKQLNAMKRIAGLKDNGL